MPSPADLSRRILPSGPDRWDITGALLCLTGVAVIMYAPRAASH